MPKLHAAGLLLAGTALLSIVAAAPLAFCPAGASCAAIGPGARAGGGCSSDKGADCCGAEESPPAPPTGLLASFPTLLPLAPLTSVSWAGLLPQGEMDQAATLHPHASAHRVPLYTLHATLLI